jgi:hypothetical protein
MRVDDSKPSAPARPAPDRARFQQALQQGGTPRSSTPPRAPGTPQAPAGAPAASTTAARKPSASPLGQKPSSLAQKPLAGAQGPGTGKPAAGLQRPPSTALTGQAVAHARGALATPENLGRVRQGMNAESHRLQNTRAEAQAGAQERTQQRVTDLIARELTRDLRPEPAPPPGAPRPTAQTPSEPERGAVAGEVSASAGEARMGAAATAAASSPEAPDPQLKAQAALELIARIEVFVKSQRPALKMSLGGALDATVEVERTGPREVALRIQGHKGPVPSEELSRIREALEAKGLRLRSLQAE